jgi:hypothetical protein
MPPGLKMKFVKKILLRSAIALAVIFLLLQVFQPARTNPPVKTDFLTTMAAPSDVATIFHAACYDCHSNQTRWPWYSYIAPMSWQIAQDVNEGRPHVNLSEWPSDNPSLALKKMQNMSDEIDDDDMPLPKYTLIHKDARLTEKQRDELTAWLDAGVAKLKSQGAGK